jgi:hypothetical protein
MLHSLPLDGSFQNDANNPSTGLSIGFDNSLPLELRYCFCGPLLLIIRFVEYFEDLSVLVLVLGLYSLTASQGQSVRS